MQKKETTSVRKFCRLDEVIRSAIYRGREEGKGESGEDNSTSPELPA